MWTPRAGGVPICTRLRPMFRSLCRRERKSKISQSGLRDQESAGHTEESFGYATLCGGRTVVSPHPNPLPRGDGTAAARGVFCTYWLGKLRRGNRQQTADHSPSPLGCPTDRQGTPVAGVATTCAAAFWSASVPRRFSARPTRLRFTKAP